MKTGRFSSIEFRIITLIISVLFITGIFTVYFMYYTQRTNLIAEAERGLNLNTETLTTVLRNMMLDGKAPLLVKSMEELRNEGDYKEISIYRTNGMLAFSDYKTLEYVNSHQSNYYFEETPRIQDKRTEAEIEDGKDDVADVLKSKTRRVDVDEKLKLLEYYYPITNLSDCMKCHGSEFPFRGVLSYKLSLVQTYLQIDRARDLIIAFFGSVAVILILVLIVFFRNLVINPIRKIGKAVELLGEGDFTARCDLKRRDELGSLAQRINIMIKGLEERFKLSKYVSGSTRTQIENGGELSLIKRRKNIVVLFSDVRGFTAYTESHKEEEVIENLNRILETQAETVEQCGGDVDKFIGDAIMAVFEDSRAAINCAFEIINRVKSLKLGLEVGVGINIGEVLAGNIGSKNRREYAVIGDTVNVASRLCDMAKPGTILTTESFYRTVPDLVEADILAGRKIKGKKTPQDIYQIKFFKAGR